jgi:hypothetical protein
MSKIENKREIIRQKCIEANPVNLGTNRVCNFCNSQFCICNNRSKNHEEDFGKPRHLGLADVLIALDINSTSTRIELKVSSNLFSICIDNDSCIWNLKSDTLEEQSEETIDFLYELLS